MSEGDAAAATPFIASSTADLGQTTGYRRVIRFNGTQTCRPPRMARRKGGWVLAASYISDWIVLIIVAVIGFVIGDLTPNKRPFSLEDPNIS